MPVLVMKTKTAKKKPKVKRGPPRREFRTVGSVTFEFEMNVKARTEDEAEKITEYVLDGMYEPKTVRVKIGNRRRLLKNGIDYCLDCTSSAEIDNRMTEPADKHDKYLT